MKFNIIIGGVETIFPEVEVYYYKNSNEIVIFFLNISNEYLIKVEKNIRQSKLEIHNNYIVLNLNNFNLAYDLNQNENLLDLYTTGVGLGFAFKDENDNILNIPTPTFYHEIQYNN